MGRKERDQGNLIIVGGPAVNPAAIEFGGNCSENWDNRGSIVVFSLVLFASAVEIHYKGKCINCTVLLHSFLGF